MKKQLEQDHMIEDFENDDIIEEWQYELSADLAHDFLEAEILPKIEAFDLCNPEDAYISGVTTYALFINLISRLAAYGFSQSDLHDTLEEHYGISHGQTLH
jgi:hypothetical protein